MVFIEGQVTQIIARARVPILVNTADRVKSPTLSPGVLMWGVNICQIPHPQGQYFWSIDVDSLCWPGGGGGSIDWCIRTLYNCFSLVKSFLEKEESNDFDKTIKINESWRTTTIASTPENASQKSKIKLKNKLEIRLYIGFAMTVI